MTEYISYTPGDYDAWICVCRNTSGSDGFFPCDEQGREVEPDINGDWNERLYVCGKCGAIIDQFTHEIVGKR